MLPRGGTGRRPSGVPVTVRLFVPAPLQADTEISLPAGAARHAQVRRVQPGDALRLFDGHGSDWPAVVLAMGRSDVRVHVGLPMPVDNELPAPVTLALGMPANERMDALVEKATELGVACIQPLLTTRSVLRLAGDRARRKQAHWQAIAEAACEQCGRARVPVVAPVRELAAWLPGASAGTRLVLSMQPGAATLPALALALAQPLAHSLAQPSALPSAHSLPHSSTQAGGIGITTLSGPEGGLTPDEEAAAVRAGFLPTALGPRVLRADTAPLAVLAWLGLQAR